VVLTGKPWTGVVQMSGKEWKKKRGYGRKKKTGPTEDATTWWKIWRARDLLGRERDFSAYVMERLSNSVVEPNLNLTGGGGSNKLTRRGTGNRGEKEARNIRA